MNKLRFGVIADPQYGDKEDRGDRNYRGALIRTREAIEFFNTQDLDFVILMGDLADNSREDLDIILKEISASKHKVMYAVGNHDYAAMDRDRRALADVLNLNDTYYSESLKGYRLVVLDTNEGVMTDPDLSRDQILQNEANEYAKRPWIYGALMNRHYWNGSVFETQYDWLKSELIEARTAHEKVLIFGHDPIYPVVSDSLQNTAKILTLFRDFTDVLTAGFAGHHHYGAYAEFLHVPFVTFKGMILKYGTAYSIVEMSGGDMTTVGYGIENSYRFKK